MNASQSGNRDKQYLRLLILLILSCAWACVPSGFGTDAPAPVHHLVVLHTNDTHGHPVKFHYGKIPDVGGLPARATLVEEIRRQNENVLVLDAGDLNTGGAESDFFKAEPDIVGYNYIGYDAMVLGNHEFDHPLEVLKDQMALAGFPFLSANVRTRGGELVGTPYVIRQFNGFRAAIFGLTTSETEITGNPKHIRDMVFEDEVATARKLVPMLRKEADVVIALTHLGIYGDNRRGSGRLARQVSGIDLIVDGNTHTRLTAPIVVRNPSSRRDTLIVQAWQYGLVLGRVDLWIRDREVVDYRAELIPINLKKAVDQPDGGRTYACVGTQIPEDPNLLRLLQPYLDKVQAFFSKRIGYAEGTFWGRHQRNRETALGDLVADAMLWYMREFKPDFALSNAGAIRGDLPEGPIRKKAVFDALPFDSTAVVLSLKGRDLLSLFDYIATVKPGEGAFPQVSDGLCFTLNRETGRCEDIRIKGQPVDPEKTYVMVTNSYLASGGDGYKIFLRGTDQFDSTTPQKEILIAYIQHLGGRIRPKVHGRITVIHGTEPGDEVERYGYTRMPFDACPHICDLPLELRQFISTDAL
jgi:5'-nucleotidase / UDP-sugar diphosphatase